MLINAHIAMKYTRWDFKVIAEDKGRLIKVVARAS